MSTTEFKVFENRLRRAAERQGLALSKNRRRDPRATDFGKYTLMNPESSYVAPGNNDLTIEQVAQVLLGE